MEGQGSSRRSRLIERFRARARTAVDAAIEACVAGEGDALRRELHKVKGDARMLRLVSLASYVELLRDEVVGSLAELERARLGAGLERLRTWLDEPLIEDDHAAQRLSRGRFELTRTKPAEGRAPDPSVSMRVIIVDDSPVARMMIAASLRAKGLEVEALGDVEQTLAALARHRPRAILSDVEMPGLGGLELLERVRAVDPSLPVVLLSGDMGEDEQRRAQELGAAGFFQKSADLSAVVEHVRRECERGDSGARSARD